MEGEKGNSFEDDKGITNALRVMMVMKAAKEWRAKNVTMTQMTKAKGKW